MQGAESARDYKKCSAIAESWGEGAQDARGAEVVRLGVAADDLIWSILWQDTAVGVRDHDVKRTMPVEEPRGGCRDGLLSRDVEQLSSDSGAARREAGLRSGDPSGVATGEIHGVLAPEPRCQRLDQRKAKSLRCTSHQSHLAHGLKRINSLMPILALTAWAHAFTTEHRS